MVSVSDREKLVTKLLNENKNSIDNKGRSWLMNLRLGTLIFNCIYMIYCIIKNIILFFTNFIKNILLENSIVE